MNMKVEDKASQVLNTAAELVCGGERNQQHGDAYHCHLNIARLWGSYLNQEITPHDVAMLMILLKVARTIEGKHNPDDYVDMCGYASLGAGLAEIEKV